MGKSNLLAFVESLFEGSKEKDKEEIYIRLSNNRICRVDLFEFEGKVEVTMSETNMGFFEALPDKPQGYEYKFQQKHRQGISKGLTFLEELMANIANHDLVKFEGIKP